jgi:Uma2 family endonuclease
MIKHLATVDDLYAYDAPGGAELVNGKLIEISPTGAMPSYSGGATYFALREYELRTKNGRAYPDNVAYLVKLPNRQSFSPDASYHLKRKMSAKFINGAPVFAPEVRSEHDYGHAAEKAMAEKRADYFAAGTLVVWDVDVLNEVCIRSYHAANPDQPRLYVPGDLATAEAALPGFEFPVVKLIPDE